MQTLGRFFDQVSFFDRQGKAEIHADWDIAQIPPTKGVRDMLQRRPSAPTPKA